MSLRWLPRSLKCNAINSKNSLHREGRTTHCATVAAVVGVVVDISFAASARRCQGAVEGTARLEAVGAEACVVCLAGAAQVAGLCRNRSRHTL